LEFQISALDTQALFFASGIETVFRYAGGSPYIHNSRNKLASEFLVDHPDADYLFFLDDDLGWPAEAALRIVMRSGPVVCGVYPKKSDLEEWPVELIFEKKDDGSVVPISRNGAYLLRLAPTGFMCIKREVLQACADDSGKYPSIDSVRGEVWHWDIFRTGFVPDEPGGKIGRWWGEDFFFTIMASRLGFDAWVDPDIEFTHRGSKAWKGNFNDALQKKIAELASPKMIIKKAS